MCMLSTLESNALSEGATMGDGVRIHQVYIIVGVVGTYSGYVKWVRLVHMYRTYVPYLCAHVLYPAIAAYYGTIAA